MSNFKHIELFAGCGGMNLGLQAAGYELYLANELSPMAAETFAYNFLKEDLNKSAENTLWIKSKFNNIDLNLRMRENLLENLPKVFTDLDPTINLEGKLLVGGIDDLLDFLITTKKYKEIQNQDIELVSGGPPCQSFSLAGKREKDNYKNLLPLSFAKFAGLIKPKVVLLENVKGIVSPFKEEGCEYFAWLEVAKAFVLEGYYPVCMMINSKYFGVPQNRPRFILLAYRKNVFSKMIKLYKNQKHQNILDLSLNFYNKVIANKAELQNISVKDFYYYDIENDKELFDGILLPKINTKEKEFCTVKDAIGDLVGVNEKKSIYVSYINKLLGSEGDFKILNNDVRSHNYVTKARFRFYQNLNCIDINYRNGLGKLLSNKKSLIEKNNIDFYFNLVKNFSYLVPNDLRILEERSLKDSKDLKDLIEKLQTNKHSQKALIPDMPAPSQLTIPDDLCHYSFKAPRTLTVREMGRIQSFPDSFEFRSKVTTGGERRKFEVPQYTQVGNAVPPLLAFHLGNLISKVLNDLK